jgi:hypothetical protein
MDGPENRAYDRDSVIPERKIGSVEALIVGGDGIADLSALKM